MKMLSTEALLIIVILLSSSWSRNVSTGSNHPQSITIHTRAYMH